jgi:hypothetical protein
MSVLLTEIFKYLPTELPFNNGFTLWFLIDFLVLTSSLKIYPDLFNTLNPESSLLSLFRTFDDSEVHLVVHHGRVVAELLIHWNKTINETFQFDQNIITACSLTAM